MGWNCESSDITRKINRCIKQKLKKKTKADTILKAAGVGGGTESGHEEPKATEKVLHWCAGQVWVDFKKKMLIWV